MKYWMMPVVDIDELENVVNFRYGEGTIEDMRNLLFGDDYSNDCCKPFYYDELKVYNGYPWENEKKIRLINLVKTYLQYTLPDYDSVLIDVSW
jgi:hypothetical protein